MPSSSGPSRRDPTRTRERWIDRLRRFDASEQTVAQFCAQEGISGPSFYQWKHRLAQEADSNSPAIPEILPLHLSAGPVPEILEVILPSGTSLRLPSQTQPQWLASFLRALEGRSC